MEYGPDNPYPGGEEDRGDPHDIPHVLSPRGLYHSARGRMLLRGAPVLTGPQEDAQRKSKRITADNVILPRLLWRRSPNFSLRRESISGIVVHETQGGYFGSVSWLCRPNGSSSAHLILRDDGGEATQIVDIDAKSWHAVNANSHTIGLELVGFEGTGNSREQLLVAQRICAFWILEYGIPRRQADEHGYGGICRHEDLGAYGGSHSDPGGFDWDDFRQGVFDQVARGGFREEWTR